MSLDGHDKMCGYQKSMFPLCIYGAQDTYSGRIQFLRIWTSNNDPNIIGRFYLDYLFESKGKRLDLNQFIGDNNTIIFDFANFVLLSVLPQNIRVDKGTETGVTATMHCCLRENYGDLEDPTESVLYGPSTQNKIERWWRDLLERMERFFKDQLSSLIENGEYDSTDEKDRCEMLIFIDNLFTDTARSNMSNIHYVSYRC